jgi:hypothetical protein
MPYVVCDKSGDFANCCPNILRKGALYTGVSSRRSKLLCTPFMLLRQYHFEKQVNNFIRRTLDLEGQSLQNQIESYPILREFRYCLALQCIVTYAYIGITLKS